AIVWSTLDAIPPGRRFDAIVAVDVVEHVANPRRLIEDLAQRLTDGGELILTTGDADNDWWNRFGANWWYCFHPEHIAFISEAWLQGLDHDSGLAVDQVERFRYRQLGPLIRIVHGMLMVLFGLLPSVYLGLRNAGRRLVSRPDVASVLGNGVSADHLFVVLRKKSHGQ
ncbi:MAG: class I SAM-dependent methyltransferase, partial [Woeseiaceae bacterium]